jgi:hypothetical protein
VKKGCVTEAPAGRHNTCTPAPPDPDPPLAEPAPAAADDDAAPEAPLRADNDVCCDCDEPGSAVPLPAIDVLPGAMLDCARACGMNVNDTAAARLNIRFIPGQRGGARRVPQRFAALGSVC